MIKLQSGRSIRDLETQANIADGVVGIFAAKDPAGDQAEEDDAANGNGLGEDAEKGRPIGRTGDDLRFHADHAQAARQFGIFHDEHEKAAGEWSQGEGQGGEGRHLGAARLEQFDPDRLPEIVHCCGSFSTPTRRKK